MLKGFREVLDDRGLPGAIRWLNERAPYRYTAVFAFAGDTLRNVCLVDKENADVTSCPDSSVTNSYCTYIRESGRKFGVEASLTDSRVEDHPKRTSYQCYYGVPLFDREGRLIGTVCHFDTVPIRVVPDVANALDEVAPLIAEKAFEEG